VKTRGVNAREKSHKVASKLGHSINMSIKSYIPNQIKVMLRERKARLHQNEMLLVAAYDQDFCILDAVDLTTHQEVELFLANIMRVDCNKTDVLLRVLENKIRTSKNNNNETIPLVGSNDISAVTAYIPLSVVGLAVLFRYEECLNELDYSENRLLQVDSVTGVAPIFWKKLSISLKSLFNTPKYYDLEHLSIYKNAIERLENLRHSINFGTWDDANG